MPFWKASNWLSRKKLKKLWLQPRWPRRVAEKPADVNRSEANEAGAGVSVTVTEIATVVAAGEAAGEVNAETAGEIADSLHRKRLNQVKRHHSQRLRQRRTFPKRYPLRASHLPRQLKWNQRPANHWNRLLKARRWNRLLKAQWSRLKH